MHQELKKIYSDKSQIYECLPFKKVYIVSSPSTVELLCRPEIVGYKIAINIESALCSVISYMKTMHKVENVNVINILRGALNFPFESALYHENVNIEGVSFLSSKRIFINRSVVDISSQYIKVAIVDSSTLMIGDIIASGKTIKYAFYNVIDYYVKHSISIKRVIVFTIGTENAIGVIKELEKEMKEIWSEFEGIYTFFSEGIFTTYPDNGAAGLNDKGVDFSLRNAIISPYYRNELWCRPSTVFEKCVIYDGGMRRFECKMHLVSLAEYWEKLKTIAKTININSILEDKIVTTKYNTFTEWCENNGFSQIDADLSSMYFKEQEYLEKVNEMNLFEIASIRLNELYNLLNCYD